MNIEPLKVRKSHTFVQVLGGQTCDTGWKSHVCMARAGIPRRWSSSHSREGTTWPSRIVWECKDTTLYQAKKKSVKVSRAVKRAKTIQYIIHFTYLNNNSVSINSNSSRLTLWRSWSWLPCSWRRRDKGFPSPGRSLWTAGERSLQSQWLWSALWDPQAASKFRGWGFCKAIGY